MKLIPMLALASLLSSAVAFAADAPPATATPAAAMVKKSLKDCRKEASDKKLTGDERKTFIKDCRAGK
ncbi:MAG TPA: PsiF family protein [Steroidobacteraceae bacterium]